PSRVAVDSSNGQAWVTAFEAHRLVHYGADGAFIAEYPDFQGPVGVAVDPYRTRVWVADPVAGQVIALQARGVVEFRVGGLAGARDLAIDAGSGEAWVTSTGMVVRVSASGAVLATSIGLSSPTAIALDRFTF